MNQFPLKIRCNSEPWRKVEAWYIASPDPARWLAEIADWDIDHSAIRLLPLPNDTVDRTASGVLVFATRAFDQRVPSHCVPFGRVGNNLYLPAEAIFDPNLTETQLGQCLSDQYIYAWHPAKGLFAFEPDHVLRLCDLLIIAPRSDRDWSLAQPGLTLSSRLLSILPETPVTEEIALFGGQDDIGSEPNGLMQAPPSPNEPGTGALEKAARKGREAFAKFVQWVSEVGGGNMASGAASGGSSGQGAAGGGGSRGGSGAAWLGRMNDWARSQLERLRQSMEAERYKELTRLLHMLDTDPDKGLRFAFPFSDQAHRGVANPSDRLPERDANFDLRRLGGGGPGDVWDVPYEYHLRLTKRYRELANRELKLGRHRRAAYIFAELLSDFPAAAGALAAGHHWREAAVLYEKKCHQELKAADCLEKGGLWNEAIALYETHGEYEKAGDLYVKLNQVEMARAIYRAAVEDLRSRDLYLAAARMLQTKLGDEEGAIDVLSGAWPKSQLAVPCVRELFRIFAETGQHERTQTWLTDHAKSDLSTGIAGDFVEFLAETALGYPDRVVNRQAADCTRVLVSKQISENRDDVAYQRRFLDALMRLVPEDRLLRRDCLRFIESRKPKKSRTKKAPRRRDGGKQPEKLRVLQLPGYEVIWQTAKACGANIIVAGHDDEGLRVARASWTVVQNQLLTWPVDFAFRYAPIVLAAGPLSQHVLVDLIGCLGPNKSQTFPQATSFSEQITVGPIDGIRVGSCGVHRISSGMTWVIYLEHASPVVVLICLDAKSTPVSSLSVPIPETPTPVHQPIPLHAQGDQVLVGLGNTLFGFSRGSTASHEFRHQIRSITGSAPHTRLRFAIGLEQGAALLWDGVDSDNIQSFATDMLAPIVGFNNLGFLIAAAPGVCEIYNTLSNKLNFVARIHRSASTPIAMLAGRSPEEFAIVTANGKIEVYRIPPSSLS